MAGHVGPALRLSAGVQATGRTVLLNGLIGGTRALEMLSGEQLQRIR